jgi:hypothetical protein
VPDEVISPLTSIHLKVADKSGVENITGLLGHVGGPRRLHGRKGCLSEAATEEWIIMYGAAVPLRHVLAREAKWADDRVVYIEMGDINLGLLGRGITATVPRGVFRSEHFVSRASEKQARQ